MWELKGSTKICGVKQRWQPCTRAGFTGSMTRKLRWLTYPYNSAPHTFWYSLKRPGLRYRALAGASVTVENIVQTLT